MTNTSFAHKEYLACLLRPSTKKEGRKDFIYRHFYQLEIDGLRRPALRTGDLCNVVLRELPLPLVGTKHILFHFHQTLPFFDTGSNNV